ncbi:head-tail adaptor protein [Ochrobactrum sp. C6C9]|uniref:head-tail adaptor protein n=1 Tax=Ochrobactrum sp. C6C9 TaxID=2736662 RepID=UPI003530020F|nr:head-tail adaptor protein [Ochrobactrum sp. C6C9]
MAIGAGQLFHSVAFDKPGLQPDGQGGFSGWVEIANVRANIRNLRGGETVQAARLQGKQPVVATIRNAGVTRLVTTDCRMRDLRTGEVYNIRAIVIAEDRQFIEITAERGVTI